MSGANDDTRTIPWQQLQDSIAGDLGIDTLDRMLYATDASIYQEMPLAVVYPKNPRDCCAIVCFANSARIALIPRGGGTSLAGQCVGAGLVVDFTRYMNRMLDLDPAQACVRVQPGMILQDLNVQLQRHGLELPVDPSTASRCTLGGMLGNNSWGAHTNRNGSMREFVRSIETVLSDGSLAVWGEDTGDATRQGFAQTVPARVLEDQLREVVTAYASLSEPPAHTVERDNAGYALSALARMRPWNANGEPWNPAKLFCGAEGSLGLVTEMTLNLRPLTQARALLCAVFSDLASALRSVGRAREAQAACVELLDAHILQAARSRYGTAAMPEFLDESTAAVLMIEFEGGTLETVEQQRAHLCQALGSTHGVVAVAIAEAETARQMWDIRRAGLAMLMGTRAKRKPVTAIEDTAVPVQRLPEYAAAVAELCRSMEIDCVFYGPVGVGVLHLRPFLDLSAPVERERLQHLMDAVAECVRNFDGTVTSKHGDGRLRAAFLERQLGEARWSQHLRVKRLFDPRGIFNPGKIVDAPDLLDHLRNHQPESTEPLPEYFDWKQSDGFLGAVRRCNGAGVCVRRSGGMLCPSYQATGREADSTRGRANVLRQLLEGRDPQQACTAPELHQVMRFCLGCKACRSECPAGVDMARLKMQVQQMNHDARGMAVGERMLAHIGGLARWGSRLPKLGNRLMHNPVSLRLLDLHPQAQLPQLAPQSFSRWLRQAHFAPGGQNRIWLLNDFTTEYFEPDIGRAAVELLHQAGYEVWVTPPLPPVQALLSMGHIRRAADAVYHWLQSLPPLESQTHPPLCLVGLEPSELLGMRYDLPDLLQPVDLGASLSARLPPLQLFEEFLDSDPGAGLRDRLARTRVDGEVLLHAHCHQRSLVAGAPGLSALQQIQGVQLICSPAQCCGMAGMFGYQRTSYELSLRIANRGLIPFVREHPDCNHLLASGFSCRRQVQRLLGRRALHPVQFVSELIQGQ